MIFKIKFDATFNDVFNTTDEVDAFVQTFLTEYGHVYHQVSIVEGIAFEGCTFLLFNGFFNTLYVSYVYIKQNSMFLYR
jgi:hypothetical protein